MVQNKEGEREKVEGGKLKAPRKKRLMVSETMIPDLEKRLEERLQEKAPDRSLKLRETVERLRPTIQAYLDKGWTLLDIAVALKGPNFDIEASTFKKYFETGLADNKPTTKPARGKKPSQKRTAARATAGTQPDLSTDSQGPLTASEDLGDLVVDGKSLDGP